MQFRENLVCVQDSQILVFDYQVVAQACATRHQCVNLLVFINLRALALVDVLFVLGACNGAVGVLVEIHIHDVVLIDLQIDLLLLERAEQVIFDSPVEKRTVLGVGDASKAPELAYSDKRTTHTAVNLAVGTVVQKNAFGFANFVFFHEVDVFNFEGSVLGSVEQQFFAFEAHNLQLV